MGARITASGKGRLTARAASGSDGLAGAATDGDGAAVASVVSCAAVGEALDSCVAVPGTGGGFPVRSHEGGSRLAHDARGRRTFAVVAAAFARVASAPAAGSLRASGDAAPGGFGGLPLRSQAGGSSTAHDAYDRRAGDASCFSTARLDDGVFGELAAAEALSFAGGPFFTSFTGGGAGGAEGGGAAFRAGIASATIAGAGSGALADGSGARVAGREDGAVARWASWVRDAGDAEAAAGAGPTWHRGRAIRSPEAAAGRIGFAASPR
jgi:hypothetical protein